MSEPQLFVSELSFNRGVFSGPVRIHVDPDAESIRVVLYGPEEFAVHALSLPGVEPGRFVLGNFSPSPHEIDGYLFRTPVAINMFSEPTGNDTPAQMFKAEFALRWLGSPYYSEISIELLAHTTSVRISPDGVPNRFFRVT